MSPYLGQQPESQEEHSVHGSAAAAQRVSRLDYKPPE